MRTSSVIHSEPQSFIVILDKLIATYRGKRKADFKTLDLTQPSTPAQVTQRDRLDSLSRKLAKSYKLRLWQAHGVLTTFALYMAFGRVKGFRGAKQLVAALKAPRV